MPLRYLTCPQQLPRCLTFIHRQLMPELDVQLDSSAVTKPDYAVVAIKELMPDRTAACTCTLPSLKRRRDFHSMLQERALAGSVELDCAFTAKMHCQAANSCIRNGLLQAVCSWPRCNVKQQTCAARNSCRMQRASWLYLPFNCNVNCHIHASGKGLLHAVCSWTVPSLQRGGSS